jgi:hypothetical protein
MLNERRLSSYWNISSYHWEEPTRKYPLLIAENGGYNTALYVSCMLYAV